MDRSSIHTSVVIEVANQQEPEDQKTYQIDFDDLDIPKGYAIDQVFCGENVTVYALFEVPEESNIMTDEHLSDATPKVHEGYRFLHRDSTIRKTNQKKLNGFKHNIATLDSEESLVKLPKNKNGSFYCLKHLSGDYDMLTPERDNSDLKVLYSKSTVSKSLKPTKFKAISKGVNTDIVQSPRIIQEIEKAVKQNIPFSKTEGKDAGAKSFLSRPSYEVIEMEMRQSFSSLNSYGESGKHSKNSIPNFFLVPLLMMEDGILSHFQSNDMTQKVAEGKGAVLPEKVCMATNTDSFSESAVAKTEEEDNEATDGATQLRMSKESKSKCESSNSQQKLNNKGSILVEIKKLQGKLNALIKSIESDNFEMDAVEDEVQESNVSSQEPPTVPKTPETLPTELMPLKRNWKKLDDTPILSTLSYPECKKYPVRKKQRECIKDEKTEEVSLVPTKSNSTSCLSGGGSRKSEIIEVQSASVVYADDKSGEELQKVLSQGSVGWSKMENRRGTGMSKSATNVNALDHKFNFINGSKKSLSFDSKAEKLEISCLKKIKNTSFKLEGNTNKWIPQKGEGNLKCEMGDEAFKKPKHSKMDLLSLAKEIKKMENLQLDKTNPDSKSLNEEEGDAKLMYPKQNFLSKMLARKGENIEVHFCKTVGQPSKNLLSTEKNVVQISEKFEAAGHSTETDLKVSSDPEKPMTSNKSCRKVNMGNCNGNNVKKEVKTVKKLNNQTNRVKFWEKTPKPEGKDLILPEIIKQRSVTGSRKFTLKGTAESKLHVDRLMKSENSIGSKTTNVEKLGLKGEWPSRASPQRRGEPAEYTIDVSYGENKEEAESEPKTNTLTVVNKKTTAESDMGLGKKRETMDESAREATSPQSIRNIPGVLVELFPEKPKSDELLRPERKECANLKITPNEVSFVEDNSKVEDEVNDDTLDAEKPVVKSVWALTKVLLFEDGSKKFEILEASLTPPGYSLPKNSPE